MTDYKHILILSAETAENVSDKLIIAASDEGVGLVLSDEKGLTALSKGINPHEMRRLSNVLPKGIEARKANGILHKLDRRAEKQNVNSDYVAANSTVNESGRIY